MEKMTRRVELVCVLWVWGIQGLQWKVCLDLPEREGTEEDRLCCAVADGFS